MVSAEAMTALPTWVADPGLASFWARVQGRFEQAGLAAQGTVRVSVGTRAERQVVGALLGRTLTQPAVTVDLAQLDARLQARSGVGGLADVLTQLGLAPEDRPALRAARLESRERPLAIAAERVDAAWGAEWITGLRRSGLLTNRGNAESVVRDAVAVLVDLTGAGDDRPRRPQSRVELGARILGDAHALDRDRLVHQVVLRGLAAAEGIQVPGGSRRREELWARFGVEPDMLSRTCLTLRLPVHDASPVGRRLRIACDAGDPVHVTEWDLRRIDRFAVAAGTRVLVCENPRVLEALAERSVTGWASVCTSGEPNLVVDRVLTNLARNGADLRYHGDFDWPGIAIVNRAIAGYVVTPWQMLAADYVDAVRSDGPALVGSVVEPGWDAELGAAMRSHGHAVHEESVLTSLIDALPRRDDVSRSTGAASLGSNRRS